MTTQPTNFDTSMMLRAIKLARKGEGGVEPNPMVGCVLVKKGKIIGEGYHRRFGGPHAEIEALRNCKTNAKGATAYVTLEPCCYYGKTPPCTEALIQACIHRVIYGVVDPHHKVRGRGLQQLRKAGIEVIAGPLQPEAHELIAPFATLTCKKRPYVIAKWAQSLDGKLATRTGDSKWISSEASRRMVHRLRSRVDAILVGVGTVMRDDPLLTAREVPIRRTASRVVLDTNLSIAETRRLIRTANENPTIIFTGPPANPSKIDRLQRKGVEIITVSTTRTRVSIKQCLKALAQRDMTNVLVEGGPTVLTEFFERSLIDEAFAFVSPDLIGGQEAPGVLNHQGISKIAHARKPLTTSIRRSDSDVLFHLRLTEPPHCPPPGAKH